ncbi:MAG: alanine racemase, partial [Anaerolineae bacterium]
MQHHELPRPNWLEIDPSAIASNTRLFKKLAPNAQVMAVVKANAYGHGAVAVARAALGAGATWCGVAALNEAIE